MFLQPPYQTMQSECRALTFLCDCWQKMRYFDYLFGTIQQTKWAKGATSLETQNVHYLRREFQLSYCKVFYLHFQQTSWSAIVQTLWRINPAISICLTERYKIPTIRQEVGKLVRSNTVDVLGIPGALTFLLGDRLDPHVHRDLKVVSSLVS